MGPLLDDRRVVSRILKHWLELAGEQRIPRRGDIDRFLIAEDWPHCVMIDVDVDIERSRFVLVGEELRPSPGETLEGWPIAECPTGTLLSTAIAPIDRVIALRQPVTRGGPATHLGVPILYRAVLMPLSEDGKTIDRVFGAANCREISVNQDQP
jgi:hypothetical protein